MVNRDKGKWHLCVAIVNQFVALMEGRWESINHILNKYNKLLTTQQSWMFEDIKQRQSEFIDVLYTARSLK